MRESERVFLEGGHSAKDPACGQQLVIEDLSAKQVSCAERFVTFLLSCLNTASDILTRRTGTRAQPKHGRVQTVGLPWLPPRADLLTNEGRKRYLFRKQVGQAQFNKPSSQHLIAQEGQSSLQKCTLNVHQALRLLQNVYIKDFQRTAREQGNVCLLAKHLVVLQMSG